MNTPLLSEIRAAACRAIDRNRNTRQKTMLLTYASTLIRSQSAAIRVERAEVAGTLRDTCARVHSEIGAASPELPKPNEKKPVQSIRTVPSA